VGIYQKERLLPAPQALRLYFPKDRRKRTGGVKKRVRKENGRRRALRGNMGPPKDPEKSQPEANRTD